MAELHRECPVHLDLAEHLARIAGAEDDRAVFAYVVQLVGHRGKEAAQAGVLPAAGGAEAHAQTRQAAYLPEDLAVDLRRVVAQQRAVDVACNKAYQAFTSL